MIDGSERPNRQLGFELHSSHVIENRNNDFTCRGFCKNSRILLVRRNVKDFNAFLEFTDIGAQNKQAG